MKTNAQTLAAMADTQATADQRAKDAALALAKSAGKFHTDVFAACRNVTNAMAKVQTVKAAMIDLIKSRYGDVAPTYAQFREDHKILAALAVAKGLKDNQHVRKPYNAAIKSVFGALPTSDSAAASAKRAQRESRTVTFKAKPGAKKGETAERTSEQQAIEAFIAKHGLFNVLRACTELLESDDSTKSCAKNVRNAIKAGEAVLKAA